MAVITYVGLKELDSIEESTTKTLSEKEAEKIDFVLPRAELKLHVKTLNTGGNAKVYKMRLKADSPKGKFDVEDEDWDLKRTIHLVFEEMVNVIKKRLKV